MTVYLTNPAKHSRKRAASKASKRKTRRKPPKGFRSWKAYMAHIRGKRKGAKKPARRSTPMAKKRKHSRRRTTRAAAAPAKRTRRRHYRRNPGLRGVGSTAAQVGVAVLGLGLPRGISISIGSAIQAAVKKSNPASKLDLTETSTMGIALQLVVSAVTSALASKALPAKYRLAFNLGAFMGPAQSIGKRLQIPVLSAGLSSYPGELSAYPGLIPLAAYPPIAPGLGAAGPVLVDDTQFDFAANG